jgi:hypothetical protein
MAADNIMSIEQATEQMPSHQADLAALYQSYVGASLASSQALIGSCQTMQGALLAFLQSRAKESLSAGKRLAECGSPQSALEIQLDFAGEALQSYADQFHTLERIMRTALDECCRPLRRTADAVASGADRNVAAA